MPIGPASSSRFQRLHVRRGSGSFSCFLPPSTSNHGGERHRGGEAAARRARRRSAGRRRLRMEPRTHEGGARRGWAHGRPWQLDADQGDAANPGPTGHVGRWGWGCNGEGRESSAKAGYGGARGRVERGEIHHLRRTMLLLSSGCCSVRENSSSGN